MSAVPDHGVTAVVLTVRAPARRLHLPLERITADDERVDRPDPVLEPGSGHEL